MESAVTYDPAKQNAAQLSVEPLRWPEAVEGGCSRGAIHRLAFPRSGHELVLQHAAADGSWRRLFPAQERCLNSPQGSCGQATCLVRPNQLFGSIRDLRNFAWAEYNGLSLILRQRLLHGFRGRPATRGRTNLDISTDSNGGGVPSQQYNLAADYGNSNWDIRHRFCRSPHV